MNLAWVVLVVTVVAGPPATAAMLCVARDAAMGQGGEPRQFFVYLRRFFWRAWGMGLVSLLGSIILWTDLLFYANLNVGVLFLIYIAIVWLEFLLIAWPLLVDRPEMPIPAVLRNAAALTLRMPWANLGFALVVIFVSLLSLSLAVAVALALAAFVSLMAQHYLNIQAPDLANFPPRLDRFENSVVRTGAEE
jgi:uncharacterized membrane protein YesL